MAKANQTEYHTHGGYTFWPLPLKNVAGTKYSFECQVVSMTRQVRSENKYTSYEIKFSDKSMSSVLYGKKICKKSLMFQGHSWIRHRRRIPLVHLIVNDQMTLTTPIHCTFVTFYVFSYTKEEEDAVSSYISLFIVSV